MASAQVNKGLTAKAALATFSQSGGTAGDSYVYALGEARGPGRSLWTSASNAATLSVGANAIAAAKSTGSLFGLTVTATDVTLGLSSPAVLVNVVVGGNGNDVIHLASLPGIANAAPTFIYGLAGVDTIDGSGMAGVLYFDSGTGPGIMTGGSGGNVYEYGAAADSTASAMDIITNFNVALDLIDLTGVGIPFQCRRDARSRRDEHRCRRDRLAGERRQYVRLCQYQQPAGSADRREHEDRAARQRRVGRGQFHAWLSERFGGVVIPGAGNADSLHTTTVIAERPAFRLDSIW